MSCGSNEGRDVRDVTLNKKNLIFSFFEKLLQLSLGLRRLAHDAF